MAGVSRIATGPWGSRSLISPTLTEAIGKGAFHLKQDFKLLENIVPLGLGRYLELIDRGDIDPYAIDWALYHFSSDHFREELLQTAERIGAPINADKIFSNLYDKGNTGSASIYVMLEELFNGGRLRDGEKILCMVPESGRFVVSFVQMTVVGDPAPENTQTRRTSKEPVPEPIDNPVSTESDDIQKSLLRRLTGVWIDFERELNSVPIIEKLNRRKLRLEDYQSLLLNLRQQVIDGARWIARAASNVTIDSFDIRSQFLTHAHEEHRDFKLLEADFVAVGGRREDILEAEKNIGSEALSAWMFFKSSRENPIDLLGAMFIIEGLGQRLAAKWGRAIQTQLGLSDDQVSFLLYHGENDDNHMDHMWAAFERIELTPAIADDIVKSAKVTARLYRLQLEEVGQDMTYPADFNPAQNDTKDPDPWLALFLDESVPLDDQAKLDLMRGMKRGSRKIFLPYLRPLAGLTIVLLQTLRAVLPARWSSSPALHNFICWGLEHFASPEANRLILRHFHIGTEILRFIKDNVPGAEVDTVALRPCTIEELKDNVFLQHDLNIFNFVIELNAHLRATERPLSPPQTLNFDAITDGPFPIGDMPQGRLNKIDLQTAVVSYTPVYQLFLSDNDFWRASNSLQLDETIAIYIARLLETTEHLFLARNTHPMLPLSTLNAGFRLMLHGLAAEQLHYFLRLKKTGGVGASVMT